MAKIILAACLLFASAFGFSQQVKKVPPKEKPPTQKEMSDMMKEMQKELDKLSPENKRLMDSMGVKMPSPGMIPKITGQQMASAYESEGTVIPAKKVKLIAALPKKIFTSSELNAYLKSTDISIAAS